MPRPGDVSVYGATVLSNNDDGDRNIFVSTGVPVNTVGQDGDIWLTYTSAQVSMSHGYVKTPGGWQVASAYYVKVAGVWRPVTNTYVRVNGIWKQSCPAAAPWPRPPTTA